MYLSLQIYYKCTLGFSHTFLHGVCEKITLDIL